MSVLADRCVCIFQKRTRNSEATEQKHKIELNYTMCVCVCVCVCAYVYVVYLMYIIVLSSVIVVTKHRRAQLEPLDFVRTNDAHRLHTYLVLSAFN